MSASTAWATPLSAPSPPKLVPARTAKFAMGTSRMVQYHIVLLPLCERMLPPDCSVTPQPAAYPWPAGEWCKTRNVDALSNRGFPSAACKWSEANLAQSGTEQWTVPAGPSDGALSP